MARMNGTNPAKWAGVALAGLLAACAAPEKWTGPETVGRLPSVIIEASGLAASRREPALFWTHADSGGEPVLQAIDATGVLRGAVRIEGARNIDWEDLASFTLDGRAWLLVADTGDNNARRKDCALLVVEEPAASALRTDGEITVPVAWKIPVTYPDGPRDCEAVAVDAAEGAVYLLAKRVVPHGLYVVPLRAPKAGAPVASAKRVGEMPAFPPAPERLRMLPIPSGMYRAQPTAMDFSADGRRAVVTTYGEALVYPRGKDESWAEALARPGTALAPHGMFQAEAAAFERGGDAILVTGEGVGASVQRYRRAP